MTNIPQKKSGLYTQIPTSQPFLDSKVNFYNGKIFSESFWTLAFLDLDFWTPNEAQNRVSLWTGEPPPPFWTVQNVAEEN